MRRKVILRHGTGFRGGEPKGFYSPEVHSGFDPILPLGHNFLPEAFYSNRASKISARFISAQYCRESLRTSLKYSGVRFPCC